MYIEILEHLIKMKVIMFHNSKLKTIIFGLEGSSRNTILHMMVLGPFLGLWRLWVIYVEKRNHQSINTVLVAWMIFFKFQIWWRTSKEVYLAYINALD